MVQYKIIEVMPLPSWEMLGALEHQAFEALERELGAEGAPRDPEILDWVRGLGGRSLGELPRLPELEHRLSAQMLERSPDDSLSPRTPGEMAALGEAVPMLSKMIDADATDLAEQMVALHALGFGSRVDLRTRGVYSLPDRLGNYVIFPEPEAVGPGLARLQDFVAENLPTRPAFVASVAMTAVCNLHPFSDGNGRLSRLVFNGLLRARGAADFYFPLHEIGRVSRGGFLIAMRLAQYRGEWAPLAAFLRQAVLSLRDVTAAHRRSASVR